MLPSPTALEGLSALDPASSRLRAAVRRVLPPGALKDVLHGRVVGHPLHPILVQGSLGALLSASVLDAVPGSERAATTLVAVGLAGVPLAAAAGLADWSELHEQQQRVGLVHAAATATASTLYAVSLAARLRGRHRAGRLWGWTALAIVGIGSHLGGHLSFRQAAGANHVEDVPHLVRPGWHDLCRLDDLPDGRPARRMLGGDNDDVPLFVLRRGDSAVVLADRCSHLSAPLHEGDLVDDGGTVVGDQRPGAATCIVCPWHGSTFALADGAVVRGPATAPAPRFRTRVDAGVLQVALPGAG